MKNIQNWPGGTEGRQRRLPAPENLNQLSATFRRKHLLGFFTGWEVPVLQRFLHSEVKNHRYLPQKFLFWFLVQCSVLHKEFETILTSCGLRSESDVTNTHTHHHQAHTSTCIAFHSSHFPLHLAFTGEVTLPCSCPHLGKSLISPCFKSLLKTVSSHSCLLAMASAKDKDCVY